MTEQGLNSIPLVGNYLVSGDFQLQNQALGDIAQAILRLETGAAAPIEEKEEMMRRYGPRPGDNPETIEQKLNGLMQRYENAKVAAGPQYAKKYEDAGGGGFLLLQPVRAGRWHRGFRHQPLEPCPARPGCGGFLAGSGASGWGASQLRGDELSGPRCR